LVYYGIFGTSGNIMLETISGITTLWNVYYDQKYMQAVDENETNL